MKKEQVLSALSALGFIPEELESIGYRFEFEGLALLFMDDSQDSDCVSLVAPGVFEISDDNRVVALEAMVKLCGSVKFVQAQIMFGDSVWLNYQHYIGDGEVTPELLEHMINALAYATVSFHKIINEAGNED